MCLGEGGGGGSVTWFKLPTDVGASIIACECDGAQVSIC